jgi:hypothetical protein
MRRRKEITPVGKPVRHKRLPPTLPPPTAAPALILAPKAGPRRLLGAGEREPAGRLVGRPQWTSGERPVGSPRHARIRWAKQERSAERLRRLELVPGRCLASGDWDACLPTGAAAPRHVRELSFSDTRARCRARGSVSGTAPPSARPPFAALRAPPIPAALASFSASANLSGRARADAGPNRPGGAPIGVRVPWTLTASVLADGQARLRVALTWIRSRIDDGAFVAFTDDVDPS